MWKIVVSSGVCVLILFGIALMLRNGEPTLVAEQNGMVIINSLNIPVFVADTSVLQEKGLSGRESLPQDSGMFFIMEQSGFHGFWMKDMYFSIDIVWIDETFRIIDITANATPESYPEVFRPNSSAKYVLEVNAGFAREHRISTGDEVFFQWTRE